MTRIMISEGRLREKLAKFFLTLPQPENRTKAQWEEYRTALNELRLLENAAIFAGQQHPPVLRKGDVGKLVTETLIACGVLTGAASIPLRLFRETPPGHLRMANPRLIEIAVCELVRAVCKAGCTGITAVVRNKQDELCIRLRGDVVSLSKTVPSTVQIIARQHQGRVLISADQVSMSLPFLDEQAWGSFAQKTWAEMVNNPLSAPWSRLYTLKQ